MFCPPKGAKKRYQLMDYKRGVENLADVSILVLEKTAYFWRQTKLVFSYTK